MSPEPQAARDAALEEAVQAAIRVGNFGDYRREELTEDFGQPRFDMMQAIISAIRALRATPPAAAPEITQEQARKMRDALCKAAAQFEYYGMQHAAKGTAEAHAKAKTNCDMADMCRAALAGVPRE